MIASRHTYVIEIVSESIYIPQGSYYLKVTTACSVVLLPSSQPFGKIPGDPQFISEIKKGNINKI